MLSVLIPTYNYKCYALVSELQRQLELSGEEYEIIVAEDGGKDQVVAISNLRINELPHCRYIRRQENVGRAAIRNYLAREAKGEWLLFMDSDGKVTREDFIKKYLDNRNGSYGVVVGGLMNPEACPSQMVTLRYKYEKACEYQRTVEYRQQHPYENFATFNFMIRKDIILSTPFDENCKQYGYEDALMGIELMKKGVQVKHIDNALMHMGLETNEIYLRKSLLAIDTLKSLGDKMIPYSHIGKFASKVNSLNIAWMLKALFLLTKAMIRRNLTSRNPNIKLFAFYKLGYFLSKTGNK